MNVERLSKAELKLIVGGIQSEGSPGEPCAGCGGNNNPPKSRETVCGNEPGKCGTTDWDNWAHCVLQHGYSISPSKCR